MDEWLAWSVGRFGYTGIALLMFVETIIPPVPSEVIMSLAGVQAAAGRIDLAGAIGAGTGGAMAGNVFWYWVARRIGLARFRRFADGGGRRIGLSAARVDRAANAFARWGRVIVCFGRVLPNMRSMISVPAGLVAMPVLPFVLFSTVGTAAWTALLAIAGHSAARNLPGLNQWLWPVVAVALIVPALFALARWRKRSAQ